MAKKTFKDNPDFKDNPAMFFITAPEPEEKPAEERAESFRPAPRHMESKSKRLQLLIRPSTAEKLKARAGAEGTSVNDLINTILEEALREE